MKKVYLLSEKWKFLLGLKLQEEKWKKAVAKARQDQRRFEEELGKVREKIERRIRY